MGKLVTDDIIGDELVVEYYALYYKFKIEDGATEMNAMGRMKQLAARLCKGFCLDERLETRDERICHPERNVVESKDPVRLDDRIHEGNEVAMSVRQALLTCQSASEMLNQVQKLKEGLAREMVFEPERLVNLNGAKETELKFGDQFKGR